MHETQMKLATILSKSDLERIEYYMDKSTGLPGIRIDLHHLNVVQAKRMFHNILACCKDEFVLHIVHGYKHGIALKDVTNRLLNESSRFVTDKSNMCNPGATVAVLRAA